MAEKELIQGSRFRGVVVVGGKVSGDEVILQPRISVCLWAERVVILGYCSGGQVVSSQSGLIPEIY